MAVYTDVAAEDLAEFLEGYDIGELLSYKGIAEGVENSNFLLHTSKGAFILTLYEKRVAVDDLPYLPGADGASGRARRALPAAGAQSRRARSTARWPGGRRRSSTFSKACGRGGRTPRIAPASARRSPRCIWRARDFPLIRANPLSVAGWRPLFDLPAPRADSVQPGLRDFIARELDHLEAHWPSDLPHGVIHADLFPDNVFFLGDRLSGLIDFHFACNDMLAYDVAICLNAWCFEPDHSFNVTKARRAAQRLWPRAATVRSRAGGAAAAGARRRAALPADAAGRFAQRAAGRAGEAERPAGICPQAALPPERRSVRDYGLTQPGCAA